MLNCKCDDLWTIDLLSTRGWCPSLSLPNVLSAFGIRRSHSSILALKSSLVSCACDHWVPRLLIILPRIWKPSYWQKFTNCRPNAWNLVDLSKTPLYIQFFETRIVSVRSLTFSFFVSLIFLSCECLSSYSNKQVNNLSHAIL